MTPPMLHVREHKVDGNSQCLLSEQAENYADLEEWARIFFSKPEYEYSLHFHLENSENCEANINKTVWNKGAYLHPSRLQNNNLLLVAHFLKNENDNDVIIVESRPVPQDDNQPNTPVGANQPNGFVRTNEPNCSVGLMAPPPRPTADEIYRGQSQDILL
ncbi:uncharacterized protein BDR25DRAFT_312802 [Lindgomyces ingoldianus]|uniref:Uncharacterized protein n=1 Tax=Lindgomyces ingoldianus TaxID=673940 RepID=A0ACB6R0W7_9PLEO|nr:uncharacterized protein BDR25DRAFT_312802 [Lindgomyces ingoldianus]KAF2472929.1 hypothetical protein BDR25DRAFT_312802 [Lindgomyces ingoldianus]